MCSLSDILPASESTSPEVMTLASERAGIIAICLEACTPRQRSVVALRYQRGFTFELIAEQLGVTTPAVHAAHARALKALGAELLRHNIRRLADLL